MDRPIMTKVLSQIVWQNKVWGYQTLEKIWRKRSLDTSMDRAVLSSRTTQTPARTPRGGERPEMSRAQAMSPFPEKFYGSPKGLGQARPVSRSLESESGCQRNHS